MSATEPTNTTDPAEHADTAPPGKPAGESESVDVLTVFECLESAFWWVAVGPIPLTIHPRGFVDLPDRPLSLHQLRVRLASPSVSPRTRAAIWSYLVRHARTQGPQQVDWTIAAAGLALPELMRIVACLARDHDGQPGKGCAVADLEAAALGAFYHELRRTDLNNTRDARIRSRLLMAAYRATRTLRDTAAHTGDATTKGVEGNHSDGHGDTENAGRGSRPGGVDRYPRSTAANLHRARRQAQGARLARQRAGRTHGGQVRP